MMKIKTSQEIWHQVTDGIKEILKLAEKGKINLKFGKQHDKFVEKQWVAVDDILKEIERCLNIPDEQEMFKQFGMLKKSLSTDKSGTELPLPDSQKSSSKPCPKCDGGNNYLSKRGYECGLCKGTGKASGN